MTKSKQFSALVAAGVGIALATSAAAQANGTPQRSATTPPGLERVLSEAVPGIATAIFASAGSNSRLQELPTSP